jgi:hypothetical protein
MSIRTRRDYGLPWPWHLLRAPHPPRPDQFLVAADPPTSAIGHHSLKASAMPDMAGLDRIPEARIIRYGSMTYGSATLIWDGTHRRSRESSVTSMSHFDSGFRG